MTELEANRYLNDVIYHELVDRLFQWMQGGAVTERDICSAAGVADALHTRWRITNMSRDEVQAELKICGIDVTSARDRVLRVVDEAKKRKDGKAGMSLEQDTSAPNGSIERHGDSH